MKALSVKNPYATQILRGEKPIEYRSWKTDFRGDILIVSSASPKLEGMLSGHALCVVRLDRIVPSKTCPGQFEWILTDVRPVKPFPVRGKLHLYEVDDALIHPTGETVRQTSIQRERRRQEKENEKFEKETETYEEDPLGRVSPIFYLRQDKCRASGYFAENGNFVLRENAVLSEEITPKLPEDLAGFRDYCVKRQYIEKNRLTADLTFPTPTLAASFVMGRRVMGGKAWRTRSGKPLKEWLDAKSL